MTHVARGDTPEDEQQPRRLASSWRLGTLRKRLALLPVLGLLALGDAYVFWNTLEGKLYGESGWVLVLVVALSIAAVVTCHQAGQLLGHRHAGYGGSVAFASLLLIFWLAIGLLVGMIRATSPVYFDPYSDDNQVSLSLTSSNVELALLMFVLYLANGGLAVGHGYKFGDPSARLEEEVRRRLAAQRRLRETIQYAESRAQLNMDQTDEVRKRLDEDERLADTINRASADVLDDDARRELSVGLGDPAATSGLQDKPGRPFQDPPAPGPDDFGYGEEPDYDDPADDDKKDNRDR